MARSEGRVSANIWDDRDYCALSFGAQWVYEFLLSQRDLAHDGVIPLRERRWSQHARGMTLDVMMASVAELEHARYVVIDRDSEELLVRTLIRNDKIYRQPNVLRAAADHLALVTSETIRAALADELAKVAQLDMKDDCRKILAVMRKALETAGRNPQGNPPVNPRGNPTNGPSPQPSAASPGERGVVTAVTKGFPVPRTSFVPPPAETPAAPATALALVPDEPPDSTQALIGEWIDHCRKRPPGTVIGQVGKRIKALLADGVDPADVRAGLAAWWRKGLDPSTLPSVVNELMNAAPARASPRPSTTDERMGMTEGAVAQAKALLAGGDAR
jgi:hypothetical protein